METIQPNNMLGFPFKGFWISVVASLLDAIILSIAFIFLVVFIPFFFGSLFGEVAGFAMLLLFLLGVIILGHEINKPKIIPIDTKNIFPIKKTFTFL